MSATKLVQMRLRPDTIERVEDLMRWLGTSTRVDAVKTAIGIAHTVVGAMKNGESVYIDGGQEGKRQILIPNV